MRVRVVISNPFLMVNLPPRGCDDNDGGCVTFEGRLDRRDGNGVGGIAHG